MSSPENQPPENQSVKPDAKSVASPARATESEPIRHIKVLSDDPTLPESRLSVTLRQGHLIISEAVSEEVTWAVTCNVIALITRARLSPSFPDTLAKGLATTLAHVEVNIAPYVTPENLGRVLGHLTTEVQGIIGSVFFGVPKDHSTPGG